MRYLKWINACEILVSYDGECKGCCFLGCDTACRPVGRWKHTDISAPNCFVVAVNYKHIYTLKTERKKQGISRPFEGQS
jgi:hypothetical protein